MHPNKTTLRCRDCDAEFQCFPCEATLRSRCKQCREQRRPREFACVICGRPFLKRPSGARTTCGDASCYSALLSVRRTKHGGVGTRLYNIWCGMKSRCYLPSEKAYKNYGGRGIRVCDEWRKSFVEFREWAVSAGYQDHLEIDRRNVNGDYTPNNCRWVTTHQQKTNRRKQDGMTSQYKGVSRRNGREGWRATIAYSGKQHCLGTFNDERDAAIAYDEKARELHGEFAHCNFPEEAVA